MFGYSVTRPITAASVHQELPVVYARMDRGMEIKDYRQAVGNTAPDFVAISQTGDYRSADEVRASLLSVFYYGRKFSSKTKITNVKISGKKAIVTEVSYLEYDIRKGDVSPAKIAPGHHSDRATSVDTWTKDWGQWRLHQTKTLRSSSKVERQRRR
ncbi:MAG: hypothetical protein ABIY70_09360 [Capsulimonas sp.]|uniref:hypothetical protein n=1 Tax=Capsulimonas sp. TaxID=2494211 RepID=UPI003267AAE2